MKRLVYVLPFLSLSICAQTPLMDRFDKDKYNASALDLKFKDIEGNAKNFERKADIGTPRCSAYRAAAYTIPSNAITSIAFDTENYDTHSALSISSFTVPTGQDGGYHVDCGITYTDINVAKFFRISVYVDNVLTKISSGQLGDGVQASVQASCDLSLTGGQVVDIRTSHNSGEDPEAITVGNAYTWVDIRRVW